MFIWAHRGASGEFPENTLLAFEQAIAQGTDGIELDVIQVEDEFYIWHDRYLPEAAGEELLFRLQSKQAIEALTLSLEQKIPTLAQALSHISGRVAVNVEVKYVEDIKSLGELLSKAVQDWHFKPQQLLVSSFDHLFLDEFYETNPLFPIGILVASSIKHFDFQSLEFAPYCINFDINCLIQADVQHVQAQGFKCFVYTVDRKTDIELCKRYGVDGIFTNYPRRSRACSVGEALAIQNTRCKPEGSPTRD
jgi:glycerophosphoryl diester phosphodiesterase